MRLTPQSTISIYKNIPIDNGEQLVFASKNAQSSYFYSRLEANEVQCTVVKKTGKLRLDISGSVISKCNYLSFVNPNFDNKVIYARILDYDYINNECVEISYAIDYWQTWMFDVSFDDMYIEREHLSEEDWDKAETNPYDPTILEFQTEESLSVGKDIEKPYDINMGEVNDTSAPDGYMLLAVATELSGVRNNYGTLLYLSDISFDNLDEGDRAHTALTWWDNFLEALKTTSDIGRQFGFIYQNGTIEHLGSVYSTFTGGVNVSLTTRMELPYTILYIPDGFNVEVENSTEAYSLYTLLDKLTTWGVISSIINMFWLPSTLFAMSLKSQNSIYSSYATYDMTLDTPNSTDLFEVDSKKLYLYPFSYLRLIAPNNDTKELHYENFTEARIGQNKTTLALGVDLNGHPTFTVSPVGYKKNYHSLEDSLVFSQIPTAPYVIDSFLAQTAAIAQERVRNNTMETEYGYRQRLLNPLTASSTVFSMLGGYGSNMQNFVSGIAGAPDFLPGSHPVLGAIEAWGKSTETLTNLTGAQGAALQLDTQMTADAQRALTGGVDGTAIGDNLKFTKPAYAANQYHPSTGEGLIHYSIMSFMDIIAIHVQLKPEILAQYDSYFKNYGYSSGRCGIPRVIKYMQGSSDDAEVPHWITLNDRETTYIKTMDCKVTYAMLPVAQSIKTMFDNGVRFIRG